MGRKRQSKLVACRGNCRAPNVLPSRACVADRTALLPGGDAGVAFPPVPATKERMPVALSVGVLDVPEAPMRLKISVSWLWPEIVTSTPDRAIRSHIAAMAVYDAFGPVLQRGRW